MNNCYETKRLIELGVIDNEEDYYIALAEYLKLRIHAKNNDTIKALRKQLIDLIVAYDEKD